MDVRTRSQLTDHVYLSGVKCIASFLFLTRLSQIYCTVFFILGSTPSDVLT